MSEITLTINGREVQVRKGATILEAARSADIYIPTLCHHPDLLPAKGSPPARAVYQGDNRIENARPGEAGAGCGLCVVELKGQEEPVESCSTEALNGMEVSTDSHRIRDRRRESLIPILAGHPHACLTCAQQEGCSRSQCSSNVPENERCCPRFGHCELQDVARYVGISDETPGWVPAGLPVLKEDPLFVRDYNLCIGCTRCVRVCRDLRGIEAMGFVRDDKGQIRIGTLMPTLEESGCRFCTACVEVCPTGALTDKDVRAGSKEHDLVPCRAACPACVDVPEYLRLIAQGKPDEADAVVREKVPFPGTLGRVCVHPCEDACRRGHVNEPVAVCALKRFAADNDKGLWKQGLRPGADTGKRAAVIGAGPAGLTAAFYLRRAGHGVTLFEARDLPGGMMRYGIPDYRLPVEVLDREVREILNLGVDFRPGRALGKDFHLEDLRGKGFDAVFLGVGAQESRKADIEGLDLKGVMWGLDLLGKVAGGDPPRLEGRVLVIGGGNTAVDAALTLARSGALEVTMACLESREQMPAHAGQLEVLQSAGVRLMPSWGPYRILGSGGRVTGVELVRCTGVFDIKGEFSPAFDEEVVKQLEVDQVILAIGQRPDLSFLREGGPIRVDRGLIVVNGDTQETGMPGVYAGGDAAAVPGSVIHAVAAGRRAAAAMDRALGGSGETDKPLIARVRPGPRLGREDGFAGRAREPLPGVESGYDADAARREASRCLQCDLRLLMGRNPAPPQKRLPFNQEAIAQVPESEGVFRLIDRDQRIVAIKGVADLRKSLMQELGDNDEAALFDYQEDKMYSKRESELIQQYLQEHGEMPGGFDDDLY
ncbi:MAG: FAD-dependent oxidoreductase [Thermodesulfobacteriota bacterium]